MTTFSSQLSKRGWYPHDEATLREDISNYLDLVEQPTIDSTMALILPHAGYRYSGPVAASGLFHLLNKDYDRVVIIGPSHYYPLENSGSILDVTHYETPLGTIPLDTSVIKELHQTPHFDSIYDVHAEEHSVQMEIPLIQYAMPNTPIVPIVVGHSSFEHCRDMANCIRPHLTNNSLVVISSDFTHFGESFQYVPFQDNVEANIEHLDMEAIDLIIKKEGTQFDRFLHDKKPTICGRHPIQILIELLPDSAMGTLLNYDTSGKQTNDFNHSVSYAAISFSGNWNTT